MSAEASIEPGSYWTFLGTGDPSSCYEEGRLAQVVHLYEGFAPYYKLVYFLFPTTCPARGHAANHSMARENFLANFQPLPTRYEAAARMISGLLIQD